MIVSAKPIFNRILFSFQVLTDCSAKKKYHIKSLLYINELIYFGTA